MIASHRDATPAQETGSLASIRLGIDIGGTKTAIALGDAEGTLLARTRRPTDATDRPNEDLARMARDAKTLAADHDIAWGDVDRVGVSLPGPLDAARDCVLHPPNLPGWGVVPVRETFENALGCPVNVENDANAAALAEWRYGAGQGCDDLVYLTMSTGIGGGLILGGRLHPGFGHFAGELGHAPVEWPGELCACGLQGCLEAYVGGAAWQRRLRREAPEDGDVARRAGGRERIRPEHAVEAAHAGDAFACSEIERLTDYLARAIVALHFTVAPERVVLGTIAVAAGEELFLAPLREKVAARCWTGGVGAFEICAATLGEDLPYRAGLCAADPSA